MNKGSKNRFLSLSYICNKLKFKFFNVLIWKNDVFMPAWKKKYFISRKKIVENVLQLEQFSTYRKNPTYLCI